MDQASSYSQSEAVRLKKVNEQRKRLVAEIKKVSAAGQFETTFFEELYPENKAYLEDAGYKLTNHGGPQNRLYFIINWTNSDL